MRPRRGIVAAVVVAALAAQLQFEGPRWQMFPLYLGAIALAIGDIFFLERSMGWSTRIVRGVLGTIGLAFAVALPLALPVPELPVPSGPEAIGTRTYQIIDRSRDEPYGERPGGIRELPVQVWYPALAGDDAAPAVWNLDYEEVNPAISENLGLPSWFLSHTRYSTSHAGVDLNVAPGTYPLVIFSHGWEGVRTISLNQIEHLVSNGYIVVAPDHTHVAAATVLEDGEVVRTYSDALPDPATSDPTAYETAATQLIDVMAADLVSVLDVLHAESGGAFGDIIEHVDLNRLGIYGHTEGGGAAVKTCLIDERCKAVLGLDPWVEPIDERDLRETMTVPALYMRSEEWVDTPNDALLLGIAGRGDAVTYWLGVEDSTENDFIMTPLVSPVANQLGLKGPIPAGRVIPIVDNYLLGFFDVFLLGTGSAALDSVTFPEVSVSVIQP